MIARPIFSKINTRLIQQFRADVAPTTALSDLDLVQKLHLEYDSDMFLAKLTDITNASYWSLVHKLPIKTHYTNILGDVVRVMTLSDFVEFLLPSKETRDAIWNDMTIRLTTDQIERLRDGYQFDDTADITVKHRYLTLLVNLIKNYRDNSFIPEFQDLNLVNIDVHLQNWNVSETMLRLVERIIDRIHPEKDEHIVITSE